MSAPDSRPKRRIKPNNSRIVSTCGELVCDGVPAVIGKTAGGVGVPSATIVHAAAALYLGLGGQDLRDALATGLSLADVAEGRPRSLGGLRQAVLLALRRTRGREAPTADTVNHVLEIATEDWCAWQALVERVIALPDPRPRAATAA
jgi:hypothetical protein